VVTLLLLFCLEYQLQRTPTKLLMDLFAKLWKTGGSREEGATTTTTKKCFHIHGYSSCSYFSHAVCVAKELQKQNPDSINLFIEEVDRKEWPSHVHKLQQELGTTHRTSPLIYEGCAGAATVIGGCDQFLSQVKTNYHFSASECKL